MSVPIDFTGGHDASIYRDQCRFERWQWHVEDERILPAPVLASAPRRVERLPNGSEWPVTGRQQAAETRGGTESGLIRSNVSEPRGGQTSL